MVKKLRKKFVITAMLSLLLILVVMIGVINAVNLYSVYQDADNLLSILTTNDGRFPGMNNEAFKKHFEQDNSSSSSSSLETPVPPNERFAPDAPFSFARLNITRSAEMPYQSRYFVVKYDSSGNVTETDLLHIAAITEDDAKEIAASINSSGKSKGMYHSYRYKKKENDDGSSLIVFIDLSASLFNSFKLLIQSLIIGALALVAMFILVFIFSSQAVAPVVESLDKQKRFRVEFYSKRHS